jgi:hypothetical protein
MRYAAWDKAENGGRTFPPWRPFDHPQLGRVEIGGIDPRVGMWNPPLHELAAVCQAQSHVFLLVAAMAPRLRIATVERARVAAGVTRVDVRVENDGYLGSYGVASAKGLDFNEPVYATCRVERCSLVDAGRAHQVLGHLDGWGRGLHTGANLPAYPGTRGTTNAAWASYVVAGSGAIEVRAGSCRAGFVGTRVEV